MLTRDGRPWIWQDDTNAERLQMRDEIMHAEGYRAADIAVYHDDEGAARYSVLWARSDDDATVKLELGTGAEDAVQSMIDQGFNLLAGDFLIHEGQLDHTCNVWQRRRDDQPSTSRAHFGLVADFRADRVPGFLLTDVRLAACPSGGDEGDVSTDEINPRQEQWGLAAVWNVSVEFESEAVVSTSLVDHHETARRFIDNGYRPAALSAAEDDDLQTTRIVSVWHRALVSEVEKDRLAKRKASAAVGLLHLHRGEQVWSLLRHQPDPRLRSYLIHQLAALGKPEWVIERLESESDVTIRRALLLVLGEFTGRRLSESTRELLVPQLLELCAHDPDAGIHGAAAWTLKRWGRQEAMQSIDRVSAARDPGGERSWYVNGQGQTLTVFDPPRWFT